MREEQSSRPSDRVLSGRTSSRPHEAYSPPRSTIDRSLACACKRETAIHKICNSCTPNILQHPAYRAAASTRCSYKAALLSGVGRPRGQVDGRVGRRLTCVGQRCHRGRVDVRGEAPAETPRARLGSPATRWTSDNAALVRRRRPSAAQPAEPAAATASTLHFDGKDAKRLACQRPPRGLVGAIVHIEGGNFEASLIRAGAEGE